MDTYGHGQEFGEFAVAYCQMKGIDIDKFSKTIKENYHTFFDGMDDGIGANRDGHFECEYKYR